MYGHRVIKYLLAGGVLVHSCGEQQEQPQSPGKGAGNGESSSWLVRPWSGVLTGKSGGVNLTETPVEMVFYPDKSFLLKGRGREERTVRGYYQIPGPTLIKLRILESGLSLFQAGNSYRSFSLSRVYEALNISDQGARLQLHATDLHGEGGGDDSGFLFQSWICHDEKNLWKVSFFEDKGFILTMYQQDGGSRLTQKGDYIVSPEERGGEVRQVILSFYYKPLFRQFSFEFHINPERPDLLTGVWYQGVVRPENPASFLCRNQ